MATTVQFIAELSDALGMSESTCSNTYKLLQAKDMVSRGGRGRYAPKVTARDAISLLLSVTGMEHLKDGPDAARRYGALQSRIYEDEPSWKFPLLANLPQDHSLLDAIVALVEGYRDDLIDAFVQIRLSIAGPRLSARINIDERPPVVIPPPPSGIVTTLPPGLHEYLQSKPEEIRYRPTTARDMFRAVMIRDNNPIRQRKKIVRGSGDLSTEKSITHVTLSAIGKCLRD
jgi:hypothetical protein